LPEENPNNKAETKVEILGQKYVIKGEEPVDYIEDIAAFVNNHLEEVREYNPSTSKVRILVLGIMNLADRLYKAQNEYEDLKKKQEKQEEDYQQLLDKYEELKEEYQSLQGDHQALLELMEDGGEE
jgi:cell division protein ZapA